MATKRMKRWSVIPQTSESYQHGPRVSYATPTTPASRAAQVATMQNRNNLYGQKRTNTLQNVVNDTREKATTAFEMAANAQEKLMRLAEENTNSNSHKGLMFLIIAIFIGLFLYLRRSS